MNISRTRRSEEEEEEDDDVQDMNNKNNGTFSGQVGGDLVMNILYRLPPFTVHRFRFVCKHWYSLILNTDFLRIHSSFHFQQQQKHTTTTTDHRLLVSNKSRSCPLNKHVVFVDLPEYDDEYYRRQSWPYSLRTENPFLDLSPSAASVVFPEYLLDHHIIDACNGLFLLNCATYPKKPDGNFNRKDINHTNYYVCNPITKHYFKLPTIKEEDQEVLGNLIPSIDPNLVFDPSISLSYKVVKCLIRRIPFPNGMECWKIYVYSSQTGAWRLSFTRYLDYLGINFKSRAVLLNGVLYWSYLTSDKDVSHCFDVEKENVCFLPLPPKHETFIRVLLYFGEHGGRLRLIERHFSRDSYEFNDTVNRFPNSFDIMETEPQQQQDGNVHCTWRVKYRVDIESVFGRYSKKEASVIHCYKTKTRRGSKEEEEEVLLLKLNDRNIVSFKLKSKKIGNEIAIHEIRCCLRDFRDVYYSYTPTLFPV